MKKGKTILEFRNYSFAYRGRDAGGVRALSDISFEVRRGETVGIAGESGSGKSTLCKSVLGLLRPREALSVSGEIIYGGSNVRQMPPGQLRALRGGKIAMVFQHPYASFNPVMKIGPQLLEIMELHGCEKGLKDVLAYCGLDIRAASMYPHNLSGGMLQRAQLALALSIGAEILIADEPTTSLDACSQFDIINLLKELVKEGKFTLIFVSHNLRLIKYLSKRTLVFYGGFLIEEGPSEEVFKNPLHPYTRYLIACMPGAGGDGSEAAALSPAPMTGAAGGCPYFEKCPQAETLCRSAVPFKGSYHRVRCFYA